MSTTTTRPDWSVTATSPQGDAQHDRYIARQLDRAGTQVKLTDLISALMLLAGGVLAFLLLVAVLDHWLLPLGHGGRWAALIALAGGSGAYGVLVLGPLLWRRINPAYAARAIEQSEPTLKNSLINFLLFRSDRAGVSADVYSALQQRAATDLSHVHVEGAVDRGPVIRVGYALATVLALCAAYTILSPKSPFQTVRRVAAPWADIARPSRVRIEAVEPGDAQVFHGDQVAVSARVYDVREDEPVRLFYSSPDGRVAAQAVTMETASDGLRYAAQLPPEPEGLQQDLVYWITAGDATTAAYRLTVQPAPTIWVQEVRYEDPAYTRRPPRVVPRQGDLQGLEGTRVTIRAQTNLPIRSATIELQPAEADATGQSPGGLPAAKGGPSAKMVEMQADGQAATGAFFLELDATRTQSRYATYFLRFVTTAGDRSQRPVLHRLEVIRDLPPEIEILTPARQRVEVPEDGAQRIEARAIDPDFGLRRITLRAVTGQSEVLNRVLLDEPAGHTGQAVVQFEFRPGALRLKAGTEVAYGLLAEDNRVAAPDSKPEPNVTKTPVYQFVIVSAEKPAAGAPDSEQPKPKPDEEPAAPDPKDAKPDAKEQAAGGGQQGDAGKQGKGKDNQASGQGSGTGDQAPDQAGNQPSDSQGPGNQPAGGDGQRSPDGGQTEPKPGTGKAGTGGGQGQPSDRPGDPNAAVPPDAAGGADSGSGRAEPLHDGEVFEKMLERLKQTPPPDSRDAGSGGQPKPADTASAPPSSDAAGGQPQPARAEQAGQEKPSPNQPDAGSPDQTPKPGTPPAASGAQQSQTGGAKPADAATAPDKNLGAGQQSPATPGEGGNPHGPAETRDEKPPAQDGATEQPKPGLGDNGQSGAGQASQNPRGSTAPQEQNADTPKKNSGDGDKPQTSPERQSPSISKKQSDSRGGERGNRSGGGQQGGGQGANQPGNDSAGSNSAADEGAGAAPEPGAGDTAQQAGSQQPSQDRTGMSGTEKGPGSGVRPGTADVGAGGPAPHDLPPGTPAPPNGGGPQSQSPDATGRGARLGGGLPGATDQAAPEPAGELPPGEKANLDYARKTTDLVLEYLKDQQQKPDTQLLEELGWTAADLQNFVARWEALKRAAAEDPAARRELEDSLRGLGLRPAAPARRRVTAQADQPGGLRESGTDSPPPPAYRDHFHAYQKGTARPGP